MSNLIEEELLKLKTNLQKGLDDNDEVLCFDILNVLCNTTVTLGIFIIINIDNNINIYH